ncbi:hypothetical protein FH972_026039 [Carpinus fangiana]|uniref:Probable cytosolic iron-sulfur protein assembly protein CIAO1 homolog n=1 Tax=Carpinus fangiana TaxID=176857 RepID=A0A5N6L302_9ROSI|nr:hypothetical protein FH972_026039 [Carpinus fangiana]
MPPQLCCLAEEATDAYSPTALNVRLPVHSARKEKDAPNEDNHSGNDPPDSIDHIQGINDIFAAALRTDSPINDTGTTSSRSTRRSKLHMIKKRFSRDASSLNMGIETDHVRKKPSAKLTSSLDRLHIIPSDTDILTSRTASQGGYDRDARLLDDRTLSASALQIPSARSLAPLASHPLDREALPSIPQNMDAFSRSSPLSTAAPRLPSISSESMSIHWPITPLPHRRAVSQGSDIASAVDELFPEPVPDVTPKELQQNPAVIRPESPTSLRVVESSPQLGLVAKDSIKLSNSPIRVAAKSLTEDTTPTRLPGAWPTDCESPPKAMEESASTSQRHGSKPPQQPLDGALYAQPEANCSNSSLHLYTMRISQHLRSLSNFSTDSSSIPPMNGYHSRMQSDVTSVVPEGQKDVKRNHSASQEIVTRFSDNVLDSEHAGIDPAIKCSPQSATRKHEKTVLALNGIVNMKIDCEIPFGPSHLKHTDEKGANAKQGKSSRAYDGPADTLLTTSDTRGLKSNSATIPRKSVSENYDDAADIWGRALGAYAEEAAESKRRNRSASASSRSKWILAIQEMSRRPSLSARRPSTTSTKSGIIGPNLELKHLETQHSFDRIVLGDAESSQRNAEDSLILLGAPHNRRRSKSQSEACCTNLEPAKSPLKLLPTNEQPAASGPRITITDTDLESADDKALARYRSGSSLAAWSKYPSHTRHERSFSAGILDKVFAKDFAYSDTPDNEESDDAREERSITKRPKSSGKGRRKRFFADIPKLFKPHSPAFLKSGRGHRSSIATGGDVDFPELELIAGGGRPHTTPHSGFRRSIDIFDTGSPHPRRKSTLAVDPTENLVALSEHPLQTRADGSAFSDTSYDIGTDWPDVYHDVIGAPTTTSTCSRNASEHNGRELAKGSSEDSGTLLLLGTSSLRSVSPGTKSLPPTFAGRGEDDDTDVRIEKKQRVRKSFCAQPMRRSTQDLLTRLDLEEGAELARALRTAEEYNIRRIVLGLARRLRRGVRRLHARATARRSWCGRGTEMLNDGAIHGVLVLRLGLCRRACGAGHGLKHLVDNGRVPLGCLSVVVGGREREDGSAGVSGDGLQLRRGDRRFCGGSRHDFDPWTGSTPLRTMASHGSPTKAFPVTISALATCTPSSTARAWFTAPHPYLPLLASASSDKTVRVYSLTSFTLISTISGGHKRSVRTCAWKPGVTGDAESVLATGSFDASAGIWKADNGRTRVGGAALQAVEEGEDATDAEEAFQFAVILEGHESEIKSVAWSCNGNFLATCSRDKSVWIWEALDDAPGQGAMNMGDGGDDEDNYETVAVLQEHEGDVKCVAWHPTDEGCLASGSYDDMVRIWREDADGEWGCVGVGNGHEGTVWCVAWEPEASADPTVATTNGDEGEAVSGPRIISCSDDLTVRLWRRKPKAKPKLPTGPRMPSIIRSSSDEEVWYEDSRLPQRHGRAIYAVAWSKVSRRVATAGSDGRIVVYEERQTSGAGDATPMSIDGQEGEEEGRPRPNSEWDVVSELEASHGMTGPVLSFNMSLVGSVLRGLSKGRVPQPFPRSILRCLETSTASQTRPFHATRAQATDGVFRDLSDNRLPMPWIEAMKRQQEGTMEEALPKSKKDRDLTPKKMSDSYHRVVLPLAQDPWLSDTYLNSSGHIRLGAIFMDLDAFSGIVAYKHTGDGVTTVTAALDRITIDHPLTEICDLEYSGQVTYATGRSSMEITCKVARARPEGEPSRKEDVLLTCTFTMVSLDPETKKAVPIPALLAETEEEKAIYKTGEARSIAKKKMSKLSLLEHEPNDPESALIHKIWLKQLAYHDPHNSLRQPENVIPMSKTRLQTAAIMQPQYRNRHQFMIFGGFLLKQTFELAFCCAASFSHARPTFISADPCTFRNPVPVGSVLYLTATVAYTDPPLVDEDGVDLSTGSKDTKNKKPMTRLQIRVDSKVRDVEHGSARPTGRFNYTFAVEKDVKVLPQTYEEYMIYLDSRRSVEQEDSDMGAQNGQTARDFSGIVQDVKVTDASALCSCPSACISGDTCAHGLMPPWNSTGVALYMSVSTGPGFTALTVQRAASSRAQVRQHGLQQLDGAQHVGLVLPPEDVRGNGLERVVACDARVVDHNVNGLAWKRGGRGVYNGGACTVGADGGFGNGTLDAVLRFEVFGQGFGARGRRVGRVVEDDIAAFAREVLRDCGSDAYTVSVEVVGMLGMLRVWENVGKEDGDKRDNQNWRVECPSNDINYPLGGTWPEAK